jgi:hypothetical protein
VRIYDPGRERKADVGDAIDRFQTRTVIVFDCHIARSQVAHLPRKVTDPPRRFRLRLAGCGGAARDDKTAVAAALEGQEVFALDQDLETDFAALEVPGELPDQ